MGEINNQWEPSTCDRVPALLSDFHVGWWGEGRNPLGQGLRITHAGLTKAVATEQRLLGDVSW